jgi:hypothetical protein
MYIGHFAPIRRKSHDAGPSLFDIERGRRQQDFSGVAFEIILDFIAYPGLMALLCLTESISATAQKQSIPNVSKIEIPCIRMVGASKW